MKKKKKKQGAIPTLVVGGVGASVVGSAMPGTYGTTAMSVGTGLSKFVGPAVAVTGGAMVLKQLKKFPKPKKRRRR